MKKSILLLLPLMILCSCEEPEAKLKDADPIPLKAGMEQKVQQDNAFAFDLFRRVIATNTDKKNIFISPLSVSVALGMAWNGADGETKAEMATALKMSGMTETEINEYYQIMLKALPAIDPSTTLNIANSIWYREGFPVKSEYLKVNEDYFGAEVNELDFTKPSALEIINGWCAAKTNNLIKNPLDKISADAMMYLINAIYFKGTWMKKFEKDTNKKNFYAEGGNTVQVDMMQLKDTFGYQEDEMAQYLDLPYGNKAFSMTVILPREDKTTDEVLENIDTERWNGIVNNFVNHEVQIYMPKFKTEGKYELKEPLMQMGMVRAFNGQAQFSNISDLNLLISRIIHGTYCDVNQEGTEAAAVTIIEFELTSMPMNYLFNVNRPFIFIIREKSTGVILFTGKMGQVSLYE